jgi:exosortase D (VPLPA-CTERM-specific)
METQTERSVASPALNWPWLLPAVLIIFALFVVFREGLGLMVNWWENKEEYNHGYLIPVVAAYLLLLRADAFRKISAEGSWSGLVIVLAGLLMLVLGELSAVYVITQYAFLLTLVGLVVIAYGWLGLKVLWVPVCYLFFMIPLPNFLYNTLSAELQLFSSQFGVAFLRLVGVSVFLEGNVIDLGDFQLQVAEACSGLRYLFPLTSFGFLCAVLYRGPVWQKVLLVLSTLPITLFMNSFRIGVIGVLVEYYGISMARGFLHDFEGWIVFMACVGLLFLEIWGFAFVTKRRFADVFEVDVPPLADFAAFLPRRKPSLSVVSLVVLFAAVGVGTTAFQARQEIIPERDQLSTFPLLVDSWRGNEMGIEQVYLDTLKLDDYLMAQFGRPGDVFPIQLYVAYYESQRKGASVHSPRACLPGGGWNIDEFDQQQIADVRPNGDPVSVNRVLISLGDSRQLVYYWFEQRGRNLTNEYLVKWFIFWDALTQNRTDGALVRLVTPLEETESIADADARMQQFVRDVDPQLAYYIPREIEG